MGGHAAAGSDGDVVLLVEDDDVDAEQVARWLTDPVNSNVSQVRRVRDMQEALTALDELTPMVVLADLTLPDADRLDIVGTLAERAPDCPLVVQTGRDDPETQLDALRLGAQDYLVKGEMTRDDLYRAVRYAVTRHRLLRQLVDAERGIERTEATLDDVAHVFAHDLRGPVRTARLLAERMLAQVPEAGEQVTELGRLLGDALVRVDRLIGSMLDYEELRLPAEPEQVQLLPLVEQAVRDLEADLLSAEGQVQVDVDPDVWVAAESEPLMRVMQNLVANSVKYRRPEVPPEISIGATVDGDRVTVEVADNGIGIPPGDRARAFRALERLSNADKSGLGLGLAICRRIVESYGGTITIADRTGPGTTVVVQLERTGRAPAQNR